MHQIIYKHVKQRFSQKVNNLNFKISLTQKSFVAHWYARTTVQQFEPNYCRCMHRSITCALISINVKVQSWQEIFEGKRIKILRGKWSPEQMVLVYTEGQDDTQCYQSQWTDGSSRSRVFVQKMKILTICFSQVPRVTN